MTIFSPQKFHQKGKNPRKLPIYPKFDVPKVPELYAYAGRKLPGLMLVAFAQQKW